MPTLRTVPLSRFLLVGLLAFGFSSESFDHVAAAPGWAMKLDPLLSARTASAGRSRVVIRLSDGSGVGAVASHAATLGGRTLRRLPIIDGVVLDIPNQAISALASNPLVERVSLDRAVGATMEITGGTVGATDVRQQLGYDGRGINVAVIDSGAWSAHHDLADGAGSSRVDGFVDFVNGGVHAYDDYGHGTHVAGIVAGNGQIRRAPRPGSLRARVCSFSRCWMRTDAAASATSSPPSTTWSRTAPHCGRV